MIFPMFIVCAGCATPTIKDSVKFTPIPIASPALRGGRLLGGDGLDWGDAIASFDDGSYTVFGKTSGSGIHYVNYSPRKKNGEMPVTGYGNSLLD